MKKSTIIQLSIFLLFLFTTTAQAQIVNIPDASLKRILLSASLRDNIASTQSPIFDPTSQSMAVTSFNTIDLNNDGEIQVSEAQLIKYLHIANLNITSLTGIEFFSNLELLDCSNNNLTSIDVTRNMNLKMLYIFDNQITSVDLSDNHLLKDLDCQNNLLTDLNINNCNDLVRLNCYNNNLTVLDASHKSSLKNIYCVKNQLSSINISFCPNLESLICTHNNLRGLNLRDNVNLKKLICYMNQIDNIDVSMNLLLSELNISGNNLLTLDLTQNRLLSSLDCSSNLISNLNLTFNSELVLLKCQNTKIYEIDVSSNKKIDYLFCSGNEFLKRINIKNNNFSNIILDFSLNPNLKYICADEEEIDVVQQKINTYGYLDCHVNSYCSFTPSGNYYTLTGNSNYDSNNNGCEPDDFVFPNLKFKITDGMNEGAFISNSNGVYSIPLKTGIYTVTPELEQSNYFNISPTSFTVDFFNQTNPIIQNVCISNNSYHSDLDIKIIPLDVVRPGFYVTYEILYTNKGTTIETPKIEFAYNESLIDYVSSYTLPSSHSSGLLVWNIGRMLPLQSGSFRVTFRVNRPTDIPPVNANDIVKYCAIINDSSFVDETPNDNIFNLCQTVVNSFDPNDKRCLEGKTIDPSKIGEYVHYQIRFENTGTYPATNVVVKDMIDTSKFDINSLQMVKASHNCYTRIKDNKVEFIFENINLPIDDANNDGYVVFKIKSLPTLTTGSIISNSANIYFDYNFPIKTNIATTTYEVLANQAFEFEKEFKLYPNPAKSVLNIQSKTGLEITSVEIYNTLGQLIMVAPEFKEVLDVSTLQIGTYYIKVNTEKGSTTSKFVKE